MHSSPSANPPPSRPAPHGSSFGRRLAGSFGIGLILFIALWLTVFHAVTAAVVSGGMVLVLVAGSSLSSLLEIVLEAVAAVLAAIVAAVAAVFSIFS
ncbi:MAG: hypothetical protein ACRCTD_03460 [Beijerinckiaceae bacterium]